MRGPDGVARMEPEVSRLDPAFRDMPRDHLEVTRARYFLRRR